MDQGRWDAYLAQVVYSLRRYQKEGHPRTGLRNKIHRGELSLLTPTRRPRREPSPFFQQSHGSSHTQMPEYSPAGSQGGNLTTDPRNPSYWQHRAAIDNPVGHNPQSGRTVDRIQDASTRHAEATSDQTQTPHSQQRRPSRSSSPALQQHPRGRQRTPIRRVTPDSVTLQDGSPDLDVGRPEECDRQRILVRLNHRDESAYCPTTTVTTLLGARANSEVVKRGDWKHE